MSLDLDLCCSHCGQAAYSRNVTYNYTGFWAVFQPEGWDWFDGRKGAETVKPLTDLLADLAARPDVYRAKQVSSDWGNFDQFRGMVKDLLMAAIAHPELRWSRS